MAADTSLFITPDAGAYGDDVAHGEVLLESAENDLVIRDLH